MRDFADIRERSAERQRDGGLDIALIPIGAYEPRWFMQAQHISVEEALDEPPRQLARQRAEIGLPDEAFFALAIGETRRLPPRR